MTIFRDLRGNTCDVETLKERFIEGIKDFDNSRLVYEFNRVFDSDFDLTEGVME